MREPAKTAIESASFPANPCPRQPRPSLRFLRSSHSRNAAVLRITQGILIFNVLWGLIWYGVKAALLKYLAGFSKEERRQVFSSRMKAPFDVSAFVARHSERK